MSKRKREAERREVEIVAKLCKLKKERSELSHQNNCFVEVQRQAPLLESRIKRFEEELSKVRRIMDSDEKKVYGRAKIIISHNNEKEKVVLVIIKNYSISESFSSDKYIVSQESQLACAIRETPVNGIAEYGRNGVVTTLRVLEKCLSNP